MDAVAVAEDIIRVTLDRYQALPQSDQNRFIGWLIASAPAHAIGELDRYEAFHDPARVSEVIG